MFADEVSITLVVGVHRNRRVAEKRFGARCRNDNRFIAIADFIADLPEMTVFGFVVDFEIGENGLGNRIPVHEPFIAIDEPFFEEANENFGHGAARSFVHRKSLAIPIARCAQDLQLFDDIRTLLAFPRPNAL